MKNFNRGKRSIVKLSNYAKKVLCEYAETFGGRPEQWAEISALALPTNAIVYPQSRGEVVVVGVEPNDEVQKMKFRLLSRGSINDGRIAMQRLLQMMEAA